jgi:methylenetetrahydrofolate--tRNA-(uracil-5-)-methyltransferase
MGSLILSCAEETRVPAGSALAVDREVFSSLITQKLESHPRITIVRQEITQLPDGVPVIIATGPLTSDAFAREISRLAGIDQLYFYDAVAPTISYDSIDLEIVFRASRYDKGVAAYLNCPMDQEQYERFYEALLSAERVPQEQHEDLKLFESCMPIEELAGRGPDAIRYGPLKPVGLRDPKTGLRPYAVIQLRQEDLHGQLWGLVGFQTRLKWGEQKRVFSMIPGLENAEFLRYGVMHRNTYLHSPSMLEPTLRFKNRPESEPPIFFAGQMTGVEGYVESAATGILAGINAVQWFHEEPMLALPSETILGALCDYLAHAPDNFQPMNANFGILPPLNIRSKKERRRALCERGLKAFQSVIKSAS